MLVRRLFLLWIGNLGSLCSGKICSTSLNRLIAPRRALNFILREPRGQSIAYVKIMDDGNKRPRPQPRAQPSSTHLEPRLGSKAHAPTAPGPPHRLRASLPHGRLRLRQRLRQRLRRRLRRLAGLKHKTRPILRALCPKGVGLAMPSGNHFGPAVLAHHAARQGSAPGPVVAPWPLSCFQSAPSAFKVEENARDLAV